MKPVDVATMLEISSPTVRAWAAEYKDFLSAGGAGGGGRHRDFNEHDLQVLYFVQQRKKLGLPADEIHLQLRQLQGEDWEDLPEVPEKPNTARVPMVPTAAAAAALDGERRALLREIQIMQERVAETQERLDARDQEIKQILNDKNEEIRTLTRQLAEVETELRLYRAGRLKPEG